jgi:hypothetical protein
MGNSSGNNKYTNVTNSLDSNSKNHINQHVPKPNIEKKTHKSNDNLPNDNLKEKNCKNKKLKKDFEPHKLGNKPNDIQMFEENLKKKAEDEEKKKKEKKQKRELDNKNIITEINELSTNNNDKNDVDNNKIKKIPNYKFANNKNSNLDSSNDFNLDKINFDKDNEIDNKINPILNPTLNPNIEIPKNNTNANLFDEIKEDKDFEDFKDLGDLENFDDDIRSPIPSKNDCLAGITNVNEEFEQFKKKIMSDKSIDKDMKKIIIQSRFEFIQTHENKLKENAEKAKRINLIIQLKIRLEEKNFTRISIENKEKIINQINKWTNGNINQIQIDADPLYQIYELIDLMEIEKIIENKQEIKNIFIPSNPDEFLELVDLMEVIKTQSIWEETNRIQRELEEKKIKEENELKQKELEKNKLEQIKLRQENIKLLQVNLNKMANFDSGTKNLKEKLEEPVEKYCQMENDKIILPEDIYNDLVKFISSIRISSKDKELIIELLKIAK